MNQLTIKTFQPHIGDTFNVNYGGDASLPLTLQTVSPLGRSPDPGEDRRQSFSLLFTSELTDQYLIQQMYELHHEKLGDLHLFLVPMGPGKQGMEYEAVFT